MNDKFLPVLTAIVCLAAGTARAQQADSLLTEQLKEAVILTEATPRNSPFAVSRISREDIKEFSGGVQELPYLFSRTPGVISWGDNGLGTGTTYLRIRGSGDSRINVTLDGVPLNSPEDQCVFWANMNSYASFLGGVKIQRGVGSSSNGDGAFGGTVALTTKVPSSEFALNADFAYGSYNTTKGGLTLSSGLLGGKWILEGSYHHSYTDGYVHGTAGNSGSWMAAVSFLPAPGWVIRYRNIGNYEHTGQAWNGVETGDDGTFQSYGQLYAAGLGRYNSLCESRYLNDKGEWAFKPFPQITTDNFVQDHNILTATWDINDKWKSSATLHYTWGSGYYDNFIPNKSVSKFGLEPVVDENGKLVKKSDFVRKKGLTQNTAGMILNANRRSEKLELFFGLNAQYFNGDHYGYLTYIGNEALREAYAPDGKDYRYYSSAADKTDLSAYAKASWKIGAGFSLFADLQYRYVHYRIESIADKHYHFFNPKAGAEWRLGSHSAFASVAVSNREPERNNFTDNGSYDPPKPEKLIDYELGYSYSGRIFSGGLTMYYMDYRDQFIRTGELSDIGEALTTNISRSMRSGAEISATIRPLSWLDLEADAAFSANRLYDFDEVVDNWEGDPVRIHYDKSVISFSPAVVAGGGFRFHLAGAALRWRTSYVSRQYMDNSACIERSIPAYSTTDIDLSYTLKPSRCAIREARFGILAGNIFDSHHACGGWVYSAICESVGYTADKRYTEAGFVPSAGITLIGTVSLSF